MATATAQPQAAPKKGDAKAAPVLRPFFTGTLDLETHTYVKTGTLTTQQIPLDTYYPKTNGYLADLWVELSVVTSGNSAATAFNEDYPFRAMATFQLADTGGQPILGPMTGWELMIFVKWGGFSFSDDPRDSQTFSQTTGSGGTGGSFSWILQVPIQFVRKEPLGALPNTNSNNSYQVDITLATIAQIYSTAPTNAGTYTLKVYQDSYRQSSGKDGQKNQAVTTPPGLGAVLYLRRNTLDVSTGQVDQELQQQEGSYRTLHFVMRDSNSSRQQGDSDWPDPAVVYFNNDVPWDRTKNYWLRRMEREYGYVATVNTANGRDYGHFVLPFITDGGLKAGAEARYRYLSVSAADTLGFRGTVGGSGTHKLTTMFAFVRPPGGNIKGLTAR
ncbi:hypothetical protein QBA54_50845 [Streptomyces sp. B21-108]|uniref:hypothetical protein n=1 Tax=Streptomyces sp. B21-108 TaxID=3039419 RepID=UPI002FF1450E